MATCEVHQREGALSKYLLCEITKNELATADSWILPKFMMLVSECALPTDKSNKKAALFCDLAENVGEFLCPKGHSRAIDNQMFPAWTAIGVTSVSF